MFRTPRSVSLAPPAGWSALINISLICSTPSRYWGAFLASLGMLLTLLPGADLTVLVVCLRVTDIGLCWPPELGRWRELQGRKGSKLLRLPTPMPGGGGGPSGRLMVGPTATCTCGPAPPPCCG